MKTTARILAAALLATAFAIPATADPPGHYSLTKGFLTFSSVDLKNGVGIADPTDKNNPCNLLFFGGRLDQGVADYWKTSLRIDINLNGPAVGISNLAPPLTTVPPGWLNPGTSSYPSAGIPLGITCPTPQAGPGTLWLIWSGMNWRSADAEAFTEIDLCTLQFQVLGCFPIPGSQTVYASACDTWSTASFTANHFDGKGKEALGQPWDFLDMKSDAITCPIRHSHDYSGTVTTFGRDYASQTYDRIKNEAVVHTGSGTTYLVVCWVIDYVDFDDPAAGTLVAQTHDWMLVLDGTKAPAAAIQFHLGGSGTTVALHGLYSESPTAAGQNGFGPCTAGPAPEGKKPLPLI